MQEDTRNFASYRAAGTNADEESRAGTAGRT